MIHSAANLGRVLPYPVLYIFRPRGLKLLLADGTGRIAQCRIIWSPNPWFRWPLFGDKTVGSCSSFTSGLSIRRILIITRFSRFDPVLKRSLLTHVEIEAHPVCTYPFVDVPATVLSSLGSLSHTLIRFEVPVQVSGFLFSALLGGEKTASTRPTSIRLRLVESDNKT